ncbi:MAG: efflux RND transporter periplasmic adaptor subunit [Candidatus Omnitrophota bacterium]
MKKKRIIFIGAIILLIAGFFIIKSLSKPKSKDKFETEVIKRGNLEDVVSSTGTLNAVSTVNVGSQVSGILEKVFVDYNYNVKKGQLLAVLDKTLFYAAVTDAEAGVLRAKAQYDQAQAELKRNQPLFQKGHLSEMEFLTIKTNAESALAALRSAQATLTRAKTQLKYTEIRSPIDGTVIERSVDAGQTIAASFQAPKLFIIAEDLTKMQIEATVDESDIGQIKEGQDVRFTVQSYPDDTFHGNVRQVRLNPTTIQNVVNYTVVVDAANEKKQLLPGMTATVDFMVAERKDVLLLPNSALTFTPSPEMMAKYRDQMMAKFKNRQNGGSGGGMPGGGFHMRQDGENSGGARGGNFGGFQPGNPLKPNGKHLARVYYLDPNGVPSIALFEKGATDGKMTEIKRSKILKEGINVITAYVSGEKKEKKANDGRPPMMFPMGGGRR